MSHADPGRRKRRTWALLGSMAAGLSLGGFAGAMYQLNHFQSAAADMEGLCVGMNTAAVVFWIAFVYSYFLHVRKTPANLEAERLNRLAEEIYRRGGSIPLQAPGRRR